VQAKKKKDTNTILDDQAGINFDVDRKVDLITAPQGLAVS
jgi:hypothetical protein